MPIEDFVRDFAHRLNAGDFDPIVQGFTYPFPVFVDDLTRVANTESEARQMLEGLMTRVHTGGFVQVAPRMRSIELPNAGRFRIWCDWVGEGPYGSCTLFRTVCYHRGTHEDHRTEMVRFETLPWPRRPARSTQA